MEQFANAVGSFPVPKQLYWITFGLPSSMRFRGEGEVDLTPRLQQLGAHFNAAQAAVHTIDPSLRLGTLNQDGLAILSASTYGRTFATSDSKLLFSRGERTPRLRID